MVQQLRLRPLSTGLVRLSSQSLSWTSSVSFYNSLSESITQLELFTGAIGNSGAFWFFGCVCVVGLFFVIFYVPETQGKSLEDIERRMMGPVRRMSSVANLRPMSFNL